MRAAKLNTRDLSHHVHCYSPRSPRPLDGISAMDDLWGNAWGSPDDDAKATTWSTSQKPQNDDLQEDDLAMPSWSTGPGIQWDQPSDTQNPLWSNARHNAQDWSLENPYGDISLGDSRPAEPSEDEESIVELPVEPESDSFSPPLPQAQRDGISVPSPSREFDAELSPSPIPSSPSPSPEPSPPSSPDAFGTFTIGTEHSDTAPFPTVGGSPGGQIDGNEWGSPWGSVSKDVDEGSEQFASDEWESAKLRQLEMDRRVVRTLFCLLFLSYNSLRPRSHRSYYRRFFFIWRSLRRTLGQKLKMWPKRTGRRGGIPVWTLMDCESITFLFYIPPLSHMYSDSLLLRYVPALTLPQLLPSGRSFTAKAMADAVKLSRNTALARTGPMSTLLAAKGSTAWETSVKSRTETSVDEVPSGWRILEKDLRKDEKAGDRVKKPTGLLAGLWSRRTPSLPSNTPGREHSPDATAPENAHPTLAPDQRSIVDSVKASHVTPQALPQPSPARASYQVRAASLTHFFFEPSTSAC